MSLAPPAKKQKTAGAGAGAGTDLLTKWTGQRAALKNRHDREMAAIKLRHAREATALESEIEQERKAAVTAASAGVAGEVYVCEGCTKGFEYELEYECETCSSQYCDSCYEAFDKCGAPDCEVWCCWDGKCQVPCGEILCNCCVDYHHKSCRCMRGAFSEATKHLGSFERGNRCPPPARATSAVNTSGAITFGAGGDADFV